MLEHLLKVLMRRQLRDAQLRASLSDAEVDETRVNTLVLKSTPFAKRVSLLQAILFAVLLCYALTTHKPVTYQVVFSGLLLFGILSFFQKLFFRVLISPSEIIFDSPWRETRFHWNEIDGVGFSEMGDRLVIRGLDQKKSFEVFAKGVYPAVSVIKTKVNANFWSQRALQWFNELETAAKKYAKTNN